MNWSWISYFAGLATLPLIALVVILFLRFRWIVWSYVSRWYALAFHAKELAGHVIWMQLVDANGASGYGTFLRPAHLTAYEYQVGQAINFEERTF